ncbi:MAG: NADH-quinone oxidoreductase subunit H [Candidatus Thorarchaeota archaeon]
MMGGVALQIDFFAWLQGIPQWLFGIIQWLFGIVSGIFYWIWGIFTWIWAAIFDVANFFFLIRAILFPGLVFILMTIIFAVWFTRKLWGRIQDRRGPFHLGKYGGLQLFADAIKLVAKEIIIPDKAKRWMYRFLPSLLLLVVLIPFAFIPWDPIWYIADLSVGLVLVFAFLTAVPIVALLSGWISGSKYTLIGGFRAANNQFACEIPLIISSVGPAMLAGSLSVMGIAMAQANVWFIFLLPINVATFLVAAIGSVGTFPFDAPVADSEVIFRHLLHAHLFRGVRRASALLSAHSCVVPWWVPRTSLLARQCDIHHQVPDSVLFLCRGDIIVPSTQTGPDCVLLLEVSTSIVNTERHACYVGNCQHTSATSNSWNRRVKQDGILQKPR